MICQKRDFGRNFCDPSSFLKLGDSFRGVARQRDDSPNARFEDVFNYASTGVLPIRVAWSKYTNGGKRPLLGFGI